MDSNIFLLESKADSLLPIALMLEMHGSHTMISCKGTAQNGRVSLANDALQVIDLLITDMPARILSELKIGSIPVLVIVNPENSATMNVIREKGFQYLEKPVEPLVLFRKTADILSGEKK